MAWEISQAWSKALVPTTFHTMPAALVWKHSVPILLHGTLPEFQGQNHPPAYTASSIPALSLLQGQAYLEGDP